MNIEAAIKIVNQLLVNLMTNHPDHLWTDFIACSVQDENCIDKLYKFIKQNKKRILIVIDIYNMEIYPSSPGLLSKSFPLSDENYTIEDITFSIYWD